MNLLSLKKTQASRITSPSESEQRKARDELFMELLNQLEDSGHAMRYWDYNYYDAPTGTDVVVDMWY